MTLASSLTPPEGILARLFEVSKAVTRARRKAARRAQAVAGDLAAIDAADAWAARAPWLIAAAAKARRGETTLRVSDYTSGTEEILEVPLDPARSPREQVEAIFTEARRLRRGREGVIARLARATAEEEELGRLEAELEAMKVDRDADRDRDPDLDRDRDRDREGDRDPEPGLVERLEAIEARFRAATPKGARQTGRQLTRLPYREIVVSGDLKVWVGRDAKSNDELTLHLARPHHIWLHAKGAAGSHVVACVAKGHTLSSEQLIDCAHLAAHFSEARGELVVEVSYLPKRYVRKPRKSAPGVVVLDREKVLVLRVDPERIRALTKEVVTPIDPV